LGKGGWLECPLGQSACPLYPGSDPFSARRVSGINEPVIMIDCTGASEVRYYYHYDGCGNVVALSNSNSQIVEAYSYDHFARKWLREPSLRASK